MRQSDPSRNTRKMFTGGEQGLPGWGVCCLSAINLSRYLNEDETDMDWDLLAEGIHTGVRFLDNIIDLTPYHFEENRKNQQDIERRIGLGNMGLAEVLIKLGIKYGSPECIKFLDKLYGFFAKESYKASIDIGAEKGHFGAWDADKYLYNDEADCPTFAGSILSALKDEDEEYYDRYYETGIRNVTLNTQAPNGSTGTMVGTSTGIEPYFAFEYIRESRVGTDNQYVGIAKDWAEAHPGEELPDYFVTAQDLSAQDHVRVQAVIQKWVDSSISKTANAPHDFTVEDTAALYELAHELGCKGVTIYRDGSRDEQVLHTVKKEEPKKEQPKQRGYKSRPEELEGKTIKTTTPFGKAYVTINHDEHGDIDELFIRLGQTGADISVLADGFAIALTAALSSRFNEMTNREKVDWVISKMKGMSGATSVGFGPNRVNSIPDAIAKTLEKYLGLVDKTEEVMEEMVIEKKKGLPQLDICSNCGQAALVKQEGCSNCTNCGYSKCN